MGADFLWMEKECRKCKEREEREKCGRTLESVGSAVTGLLPSGFFKMGASYEDAYLVILELVEAHKQELKEIAKKQQPNNWFMEMYND